MTSIGDYGQWLKILVSPSEATVDGGRSLVVGIQFVNSSGVSRDLEFSNRTAKAELLGLVIHDAAGRMLEPQPGLMIRPLPGLKPEVHAIGPRGSWRYELVGQVCEGRLSFKGAWYKLEPNVTYKFSFRHKGVQSSSATWTYVAQL